MPTVYAAAEGAGANVGAYICNPSQTAPSDAAQAAMTELLVTLGEIDPKPDVPSDNHCDNCVVAFANSAHRSETSISQAYTLALDAFVQTSTGFFYQSQGPPLGGRAPPTL